MVRVLCVGDNVVDIYVDEGVLFPGGNAVNVAVHASRLGAASGYVGALGTDAAGDLLLRVLAEEGVDVTRTRRVDGPNAYATVYLNGGDRVFGGADVGVSRFRAERGDLEAAAEADIVHTGECSMIEAQLASLAEAARFLSFDFSERPWDYVEEWAGFVDLAILSRPAGNGETAESVARRALAAGADQAVVSMGPLGALWADSEGTVQVAAPPGTPTDTLGAGDALIARVLTGLLAHESPADFLTAATAYATANCAQRGAFGHMTPLDESQLETIHHRERHHS